MRPEKISNSFVYSGGFSISGIFVNDIAKAVGTPFYVYDAQTIKRQYSRLRNALPKDFDIFYAMKANPNLAIVRLLSNLGTGVEVASRGELLACQRLGVDPKNIVFAGPAKTDEDLKTAIDMGIYSINAESVGEMKRISEIAEGMDKTVNVEIRVNPEFEIEGAELNMGGGPKKFGIDSEKIGEALEEAMLLPGIVLQGLHIFAASGILDPGAFLKNMENTFEIAKSMNEYFQVKSIDVGGGLGIPYKGENDLDLSGLKPDVSNLVSKYPFIKENNTRLIIEPGRYLVGQSGIYVTKVVDFKESRGKRYILVDGGIHHLMRPALFGASHPIFNLSREGNGSEYDIAGCLCTSVDILAKSVAMPKPEQGDLIGVFCAGAYGFTEGMPLFLSHDIPAEVLVHKNKFSIIRDKVPAEKSFDNQHVPDL